MEPVIQGLAVTACEIPTDGPDGKESDGTLEWSSTTIVTVEVAGITRLLQVAGLSAAHAIDLSAHCAPSVSAHAFCAVERLRHLEYFHDHVRIERMLFDGAPSPSGGRVAPDPSRPGLGLTVKRRDMQDYVVYSSNGTP